MKLFKVTETEYLIVKDNQMMKAFSVEDVYTSMQKLGVQISEIEYGLLTLLEKEDHVAEYGIGLSGMGPMFMFTRKVA